ncbi:MAG TPA: hypothetical protein VH040_05090 [Usitatibacter sp.]|jgi:hypothetical protein|nr:hypothetical protein [Usitatibacter sp.]
MSGPRCLSWPWRSAGTALAVAVLAWAAVEARRSAHADDLSRSALSQLQWWEEDRFVPGPGERDAVAQRLDEAARLAPDNAETWEGLGLLELNHGTGSEAPARAVHDFGESIAWRPTSPYTWANLAQARALAGAPREQVEAAMLTALDVGAAEPEVQLAVIDLGLAQWPRLAPGMRERVAHALDRMMRRNPYKTLPVVLARDHLELACPYVHRDARLARTVWPRRCRDLGAA